MSIPSAFGVVLIGFIALGLVYWPRKRDVLPRPKPDDRDSIQRFRRELDTSTWRD